MSVLDLSGLQASKETVHDRYKQLAMVETAFRSSKTFHLEMRPIYLRKEERTRAHALIVMLAYRIILHLQKAWENLDITIEEGIKALSNLCVIKVSSKNSATHCRVPKPDDLIAKLITPLNIKFPSSFALSDIKVSTRKKLTPRKNLH